MLALSAIKNAGISISPGTTKSALTFEMLKDVQGFLRAWRRDITLHETLQTNKNQRKPQDNPYSFYSSSVFLTVNARGASLSTSCHLMPSFAVWNFF
jgi:hypothetical protein